MIGKLKKFFGIEGVKLELIIPESVRASEGLVEGKVRFQSMNTQEVSYIKLAMVERYARGRGEERKIDDYEIGDTQIELNLTIPAEEQIEIDFQLPFQVVKSDIDEWGDRNILLKGIVSAAKYVSKVNSTYQVVAEAKVKGTALNPFDQKKITLK
ncbi:MAG TPA: sporulation protein [Saprospiraceae bacterium]|nr:sporulation protein [Saprospiraceae bacterium]